MTTQRMEEITMPGPDPEVSDPEPEDTEDGETDGEAAVKYKTFKRRIDLGERTLRKALAGEDVKVWQMILNSWFPSQPRLKIDGKYGPSTVERTRHAQSRMQIPVDGVTGPTTWQRFGVIP